MKLLDYLYKPLLCIFLCIGINQCYSQALIGLYGGTIIGGKLEQNGEKYSSGLGWEIGYSESVGAEGDEGGLELAAEMDFRLIEIEGIDYFEKDYKFLFDIYAGPGVMWYGIKARALIGYSFSTWIDNAISGGKLGSLSFKLALDVTPSGLYSIGVFYRPLKQKLMDKSGVGFTILPSFGIRFALWM